VLGSLSDEQWQAPSRCADWSNQDVVAHLIGTNRFWAVSVRAGLGGEPTRILATFDPAASPPAMVAPMRSMTPAEVLDQFVTSNDSMFDAFAAVDDAGWSTLAESPAGHVPIRLVASHALWDAWVHERDILLPLGLVQDEEPDEVRACLRYAAAVGPVLALTHHPGQRGALEIEATDTGERIVVEVADEVVVHGGPTPAGAVRLSGGSVELVEAFSIRAPLGQAVPEDGRWLLDGLAMVFDTADFTR
jgi:uncharacterized protein (TIGR03083 family)